MSWLLNTIGSDSDSDPIKPVFGKALHGKVWVWDLHMIRYSLLDCSLNKLILLLRGMNLLCKKSSSKVLTYWTNWCGITLHDGSVVLIKHACYKDSQENIFYLPFSIIGQAETFGIVNQGLFQSQSTFPFMYGWQFNGIKCPSSN